VILVVGLYQERDAARMGELVECARRNLANDAIHEVHFLLEDGFAPGPDFLGGGPKAKLVRHGRRVTYRTMFDYANQQLPRRRVIIANSDIYFDHTLARLDDVDLKGQLLCLSRWNVHADGVSRFFEHSFSQDAWIFETPIREFSCDWHLGVLGCENRLAHEAAQAGLNLSNPSRSVRAHHLHLSAVHNYTARERVPGPGRGVDATHLGTRWLWPIVPCMGRLDDLERTIDSWTTQRRISYVLVDHACRDGAGDWVAARHASATVVRVGERRQFNVGEARNHGAAAADDDAYLCFVDADIAAAPGFADAVLAQVDRRRFLVCDDAAFASVLVCSKSAFDDAGGCDDAYFGAAASTADLRAALLRAGLAEDTFAGRLLRRVPTPATGRFRALPSPEVAGPIDEAYRRLKSIIVEETADRLSQKALRELQRAITDRRSSAGANAPETPCAAVSFHERMGFTIARLELGVSSHNNDERPFSSIPAPLLGKPFTQVVASHVSPVTVQFRTTGKLYVLAGTDWYGYHEATRFLRPRARREPWAHLLTARDTGFEVWSIVGDAGDALIVPTQVMLVADELVPACG
jgi:hypothetical protein